MTNISAIALEIDKIARFVKEDPFELFRAATSGERIMIKNDYAVDDIETMIDGLSKFELCKIDRIVFGDSL